MTVQAGKRTQWRMEDGITFASASRVRLGTHFGDRRLFVARSAESNTVYSEYQDM